MLLCKISTSASKRVRQMEEVHARSFFQETPFSFVFQHQMLFFPWQMKSEEEKKVMVIVMILIQG